MKSAALIIIGEELLSGAVQDTNAQYLARELARFGAPLRRVAFVGDVHGEIVQEIERCAAEHELIFTTGGLGPTSDDITRDAVAAWLGVKVYLDGPALERMERKYHARGVPMNRVSSRQATFPLGAKIIANSAGTAEAFSVNKESGCSPIYVFSLPGVPRELTTIFDEEIAPQLPQLFPELRPRPTKYLQIFGLSESFVGNQIEHLELPPQITVGYRAVTPEVWVSLRHDGEAALLEQEAELGQALAVIKEAIGPEFIFSETKEQTLSDFIGELLTIRTMTVAVAESCTGGLIADRLVSRSGSSSYFLASLVTYANEAKEVFLGINEALLKDKGAVSEETALAMAKHVRHRTGASVGLSVTGIAGPSGGTEEKPVGTVWFGLSTADETYAVKKIYPFGRNRFRQHAANTALDLMRRHLLGLPRDWVRR